MRDTDEGLLLTLPSLWILSFYNLHNVTRRNNVKMGQNFIKTKGQLKSRNGLIWTRGHGQQASETQLPCISPVYLSLVIFFREQVSENQLEYLWLSSMQIISIAFAPEWADENTHLFVSSIFPLADDYFMLFFAILITKFSHFWISRIPETYLNITPFLKIQKRILTIFVVFPIHCKYLIMSSISKCIFGGTSRVIAKNWCLEELLWN